MAAQTDQQSGPGLAEFLVDLVTRVPESTARGRVFEDMIARLIVDDRSRFDRFVSCRRRVGQDIGVDLEAVTGDGEVWAVQAKCYDPKYRVATSDVDSFIAASPLSEYAGRLFVSTAEVATHGRTKLDSNEVELVLFDDLVGLGVDWPALESGAVTHVQHRREMRADQVPAVAETVAALQPVGARVQLLRACGTGKTLVLERVAEAFGVTDDDDGRSPLIVLAVPTITLVNQTIALFREELGDLMPATFGVCSDVTASDEVDRVVRGVESGTDSAELAGWLSRHSDTGRLVVATHVSMPVVTAALTRIGARSDLLMVDEAHRYAGSSTIARGVLAAESPFDRYLFATATPRYITSRGDAEFEYVSMDDPEVFGTPAHTYTFADAIDDQVLCDYQIVVAVITDADLADIAETDDATHVTLHHESGPLTMRIDEAVSHLAVIDACRQHHLRKLFAYTHTIAKSETWTRHHNQIAGIITAEYRPEVRHLDGASPNSQRQRVLNELATHNNTAGGPFILSNARLLTEGVDAPTVDAVVFNSPRRSTTDVVQIVGRALRRDPDNPNKIATVVLPLHIPSIADLDNKKHWETVTQVLRMLRTFDDMLAEQLDTARLTRNEIDNGFGGLDNKIIITGDHTLTDNILRHIETRIIDIATDPWLERFAEVAAFCNERGYPPAQKESNGKWVSTQRHAYRRNGLPPERVARLEALPGWVWNYHDALWEAQFAEVAAYCAEHGQPPSQNGPSGRQEGKSAQWATAQRTFYRGNGLSPERVARLEALPGWVWSHHDALWDAQFAEVAAYCAEHGQPPSAKGPNGVWVATQRKLYRRKGGLASERVARLEGLPGWWWSR